MSCVYDLSFIVNAFVDGKEVNVDGVEGIIQSIVKIGPDAFRIGIDCVATIARENRGFASPPFVQYVSIKAEK